MIIDFPTRCKNEASRWAFCLEFIEALRIENEGVGSGFRVMKLQIYDYLVSQEQHLEIGAVFSDTEFKYWDGVLPRLKHEAPPEITLTANQMKKEADVTLILVRQYQQDTFKPKKECAFTALEDQRKIARVGTFWNPRVPDHVSRGVIIYPPNLDQENEASRGIFLYGVEQQLRDIDADLEGEDLPVVRAAITQAKADVLSRRYWGATTGDVS